MGIDNDKIKAAGQLDFGASKTTWFVLDID